MLTFCLSMFVTTMFGVAVVQFHPEQKSISKEVQQLSMFLHDISFFESSGRHTITKGQYWGKYQLGTLARQDVGFSSTKEQFLQDPLVQDLYMVAYLQVNRRYLDSLILRYSGQTVGGVKITKPGLLAGAHLVGHNGVRRFLLSNGEEIVRDGNGTPVTKYIEHFSQFDDGFTVHVDIDEFLSFTQSNMNSKFF